MLLLISTAGGRFPWGMRQSSTEAKLLRCIGLHAYPTGVATHSEGQQKKLRKSTTNDNRAYCLEIEKGIKYSFIHRTSHSYSSTNIFRKEHDLVMDNRRREIQNRIKKRKRMKAQMKSNHRELPPFKPSQVETHDRDQEVLHPLFRKDIFLMKMLLASILFITVAIVFRHPSEKLETARQKVTAGFEQELQFAYISNWYEETFGKPLAFLPSDINGTDPIANHVSADYIIPIDGEVIETFTTNGNGIRLQAEVDDQASAIGDGIVTFAGKKEGLGNTVVVQHVDKSESWYGELDSVNVRLSDRVSKGDKVGTVSGTGIIFFALKKENEYIDPNQVIPFE